MWNTGEFSNDVVRHAFVRCRQRMRASFYRTRNPLDLTNTIYSMNFLFVEGGRTADERNEYFNFKTIATPRNVDTETGVGYLLTELEQLARKLNIIIINTINNKEVGDVFAESLVADGAQHLTDYTVPLTQSPYHRVGLVYEEVVTDDNEVRKYYYLFTNKMNNVVASRLAGCICAHMNLFGDYTERIASALLQENQGAYEYLVAEFHNANLSNVHRTATQRVLEQVAGYGNRRVEEQLRSRIEHKQNDIAAYVRNITAMYSDLREMQTRLLGLQHNSGNENEVTQFLLANLDKITFARLSDGFIYIRYRTPLLYWDEDVFRTLRTSNRENTINHQSDAYQQLIDDIFDTRKIVLWFDSGFRYSLTSSGFAHYRMDGNFNDVPPARGLMNPHHYYYNCWGDNASSILQAQNRNDTVVALAQLFAAVAGINLTDSIVLRKFINEEWDTFRNVPCLEIKETGELITIQQYRDRYREEQRRQREAQAQAQQATPEVQDPVPVQTTDEEIDDWIEDL